MILVFHMISQDYLMKVSSNSMNRSPSRCHYLTSLVCTEENIPSLSTKPGGYRQSGNGDIMFLVVEEQNFTCSRLSPPLLFISIQKA